MTSAGIDRGKSNMVVSEQMEATERKFVAADFEKCTGCGVCELVCALEREKVFDPQLSRILRNVLVAASANSYAPWKEKKCLIPSFPE